MGNFLYRLGSYCFEKKWKIIIGWAILLSLLGAAAIAFKQPVSSAISIPNTPAQNALERVNELFPGGGKGSAKIVIEAPENKTIKDYGVPINRAIFDLGKVPGLADVGSPLTQPGLVSENGKAAFISIQLIDGNGEAPKETTEGVLAQAQKLRDAGLTAETNGDVINRAPENILGIGEVVGVFIALLVLVLTLGSLIAAGMPLVIALIAIGVSMGGLFALGDLITISSTTPVLAVMLGLAVGIDYSLFIVSKYRKYLLAGIDAEEAASRAVSTAGSAVVFAALTVVIALSALTVVGIPFITTMGLAAAATIAVAAIVSLTLLPALLSLAGGRIFSKRSSRKVRAKKDKTVTSSLWHKWGELVTRKPIVSLVFGFAIVGVLAVPARDLTIGLPSDATSLPSSTDRKAYELIKDNFGPGYNGPIILLAEGIKPVDAGEAKKMQVARQVENQYRQKINYPKDKPLPILDSYRLQKLQKQAVQSLPFTNVDMIAEKISDIDGVAMSSPASLSPDGTKGLIQIIPTTDPSSPETDDLVALLRDSKKVNEITGNSSYAFSVTGSTAIQSDINKKLADALPVYLAVVISLSLILLLVAFRSILIPIKATLGFLLSVAAMFGAIVAVFQWGWFGIADVPGPIVSFIPILAIGILFGLAMDYEFFLVSSMHESYKETGDAKKSVVEGFGVGSKVVTAAAIIMVSVFAGFVFNHDTTIQAIGFGLAIGILVDAFIVRMTIVPAVMVLLGRSAWFLPKWLDKVIPRVAIEGEDLARKKKE